MIWIALIFGLVFGGLFAGGAVLRIVWSKFSDDVPESQSAFIYFAIGIVVLLISVFLALLLMLP